MDTNQSDRSETPQSRTVNAPRECRVWAYLAAGVVLTLAAMAAWPPYQEVVLFLEVVITIWAAVGLLLITRFLQCRQAMRAANEILQAERERAIAELSERIREHNDLIHNLPGMVYRCRNDAQWTMDYLSDGCLALTGYPPEALIGNRQTSYGELIVPADRDRVWSTIQDALKHQRRFQMEYRIQKADGTFAVVWEQGVGVFNPMKQLIALEGFILDVTGQRRIERELAVSEGRYRQLAENSGDIIFTLDAEDALTYINAAGVRMLTQSPDSPIPQSIWPCMGDAADEMKQAVAQVRRTLQSVQREFSVVRRGRRHRFAVRFDALQMNGAPPSVMGVARDITAIHELLESQGRLVEIIEASPDMIGTVDANGRMMYLNASGRRMLGLTADADISTLRLQHIVGMRMAYDLRHTVLTQLDEHDAWSGEIEIRRIDGQRLPVAVSIVRHRMEDGAPFISAIARDITNRLTIERERDRLTADLQRKNRELGQLLYIASHDLRSPLINIQGFSRELQMLSEQIAAEAASLSGASQAMAESRHDMRSVIHFMNASVQQMDQVLNGLLRLSRLGRSGMTIDMLDIAEIIHSIVDAQHYALSEIGAVVDVEPLPACSGDSALVRQVFQNLIDNAIRYRHPDRMLHVRISGAASGGRSVYCVQDNGRGIAEEQLERVFELFFRADRDRQGEGLGLTIVRTICERHDGRAWVESEVDAGSRFYVELPSHLPAADA